MHYRHIIGGIFLGIGGLVVAMQLGYLTIDPVSHIQPPLAQAAISLDDLESSLSARVQTVGPVQARNELKALVQSEDASEQHGVGHVFGRVIFNEYGIDGLPYCNQDFSFGCYHEFFSYSINENGIGITSTLNETCFTTHQRLADAFGCQHGIGHGLLSHGGYTLDALRAALAVCDTLQPLNAINGCYGGAVMEYNMKTMLFAHQIPPRERSEDESLYYPCDQIPEYAAQACYYWQSQWWLFALGLSVAEVGELCGAVPTAREQEACFYGIGNRVPDLVSTVDDVYRTCAVFTETVQENGMNLICVASAAVTFSESGQPAVGNAICEQLEGEDQTYCYRVVANE